MPASLIQRAALFQSGLDVEGEHRQHRAVHGHRDRDLGEVYLVEEYLHVFDRVDRHAGLTDIADHARVVGVVTAVGREVEGDGEALLTRGDIAAVEGVGFFRRGEAGVLPHGPGAEGIHGRVGTTQVRLDARRVVEVLHVLVGVLAVERIDLDLLHGLVDELVDALAGFGLDLFGPGFAACCRLWCFVCDVGEVWFHREINFSFLVFSVADFWIRF